ncbi:class I SAM-dependent methyltransferase [Microvirga antarctica]|uniref:class I SAM-dependent methyltransferase n=1 Tax=Microvirga antarctica TaxID=2819233 RepID=UPI001B315CB5|nr:class I SAM-dependent methyltransferase [Microvirga antarctica]
MTFKDHFSTRSDAYAAYRPTYPSALVDALADRCAGTDVALDVGCGSGQLSVLLARRFRQVIATDASQQQVATATPHAGVAYQVAPAERSGLADRSVDLVTAAQAAHWFDLPAFYTEVRRIGKPGSLLALISYGVLHTDDALKDVVRHFYREVVGPFWPPERSHVESGYREIPFPFEEIAMPHLAIDVHWHVADLLGYVQTWSATRALEKAVGHGPVEAFSRDLSAAWGDVDHRRLIRFPLSFRVGRV